LFSDHLSASSISKSLSGIASPVMHVKHELPMTADPMTQMRFPQLRIPAKSATDSGMISAG
jgi:hypothetical protein